MLRQPSPPVIPSLPLICNMSLERLSCRSTRHSATATNARSPSYPISPFCFTIEHPFWFVNHCCDSNSGFVNWGRVEEGKVPFAAHREIQPGEQITCDYSWITTPHDGSPEGGPWSMKCLCGHENCRHNITGYHALALPYQLAGMMPEELPTGRVPAHIVAYEPHLVEVLKAYPKLYRRYSDTLRQLQDVSKLLHQRLGL